MSKHLKKTEFKPPWWLKNRHIQSCVNSVFKPSAQTILSWEQLELPDGDFIDLCWAGPREAPIVVLLHGLEGSVDSHYIQLMLDSLVEDGWQVVVMHFRTCSGRMNRLPRSYHAGETGDFSYLLNVLSTRYPDSIISAIGFSLGANVLLKYLAEHQESPLHRALAISVPFELNKCSDYIGQFYHWTLLRTMKQKTIAKLEAGYDMPVGLREIRLINDFREFDEVLTAPLHGFSSADDYYAKVTVRGLLGSIVHPTLIIHALDDPLVPAECIPRKNEISDKVILHITRQGGHVGFIQGNTPWRAEYWLKGRILDFLKSSV